MLYYPIPNFSQNLNEYANGTGRLSTDRSFVINKIYLFILGKDDHHLGIIILILFYSRVGVIVICSCIWL